MEGLETLLEMNGYKVERDDGYWYKIEAWTVPPSKERPHGIRYNMTLHNKHGTRVFGFDNSHGVKPPKKAKFSAKRHEYVHVHKSSSDKGRPYEFSDCYQLINDFFSGIDETIEAIEGRKKR